MPGKKTSVYLPEGLAEEAADTGLPLAALIRRGVAVSSTAPADISGQATSEYARGWTACLEQVRSKLSALRLPGQKN